MTARARLRPSPQWPFWLLLAAWVCANSPQAALHGALDWLAEARHFSHQQRLMLDVASLLAGQSSSDTAPVAVTATEPHAPAAPLVPADAVLKRLDLVVHLVTEILPVELRRSPRLARTTPLPENFRAPPPHGPPRSELTV